MHVYRGARENGILLTVNIGCGHAAVGYVIYVMLTFACISSFALNILAWISVVPQELRRWRLQALERIEGTERRHRQPPKASSCLQPRELPPAMSHSKSSALPSSPTSTRMEPETQKDGCLPTAAIPGESLPPPPIQPITEGLSRSGRGLGLLEAARAITAGHTSSVEKYCDGSHMVEMISSRCARVPKESLSTAEAAAVSTSRPKGRITREMSCHAGERGGGGRLQQVSKDGEGGGDEGQGCVEVSLDLSNCNQEVRPHRPCKVFRNFSLLTSERRLGG